MKLKIFQKKFFFAKFPYPKPNQKLLHSNTSALAHIHPYSHILFALNENFTIFFFITIRNPCAHATKLLLNTRE
jgi:hypothetical protein